MSTKLKVDESLLPDVRNEIKPGKLFINNEWVEANLGRRFDVINPATEEKLTDVAEAGAVDVDAAVAAAREAFDNGLWSDFTARERGRILHSIAVLLDKDKEKFAQLESLDNGKPISETSNVDLLLAVECFEYYAGLADKIEGETIPVNGKFLNYTLREPVGVVGQIIPWNFPLLMLAWKLGPALAAGCTVVLKPAEQTPLTALRFAELLLYTCIPPGVVNIVTGYGPVAGAAIVLHEDVDKVAFTGSTEVGRLIMKMAAKSNLKKISLELGGKAPNIVFEDADIDAAVQGAITGIFFNQGEVCCAGSRLYVQESVKDKFLHRFKAKVDEIVIGDPLDPKTQMGALVSEEQYRKVLSFIETGKKEGSILITGGGPAKDKGYFVKPTIFDCDDENCTIAKKEIFGPVVTVFSFKDTKDLVKRANDTLYGLSAGIWTRDIGKAHRLAKELKAGTIWINCYNVFDAASPFGGFKQSGFGRELGKAAIELYTQVKSVWVALD